MKNRFFKKSTMMLSLFSLSFLPVLASCSMVDSDTLVYAIQSVTTTTDSDGNVTVTITYTDTSVEPLTITLPAGLSGQEGVGIANIASSTDEDGNVTLTISYTDSSVSDTIITIPAIKGLDGKGIASLEVITSDSGTTLTFSFTDGSDPVSFTIPNANDGDDGNDGVGIASVTTTTDSDGNTIITISYTDSTKEDTVITIPSGKNGEDGVGVSSVTYDSSASSDSQYALLITYTDGSTEYVYLERPSVTKWYYGETDPEDSIGNVGDFYLNTSNGNVHCKYTTGWSSALFSMKSAEGSETTNVYLIFYPNGGRFSDGSTSSKSVLKETGTYMSIEELDTYTPTREGYTFSGWYTDSTASVNSGHFTNITAIETQLSLYAKWVLD